MLKWSVTSSSKMSIVPRPKLCHMKKWNHFDGFGFTLQTDHKLEAQIIGKIDKRSPAEASGLKTDDRVFEVNGVNVDGYNHDQVVERIRAGREETKLLVADNDCQEYHNEHDIPIRNSLTYIQYLSSEKDKFSCQNDEDTGFNEDSDESSLTNSYDVMQDTEILQEYKENPTINDCESSFDGGTGNSKQKVIPLTKLHSMCWTFLDRVSSWTSSQHVGKGDERKSRSL